MMKWVFEKGIAFCTVLLLIMGCTGEAPEKPARRNAAPSIHSMEIIPQNPTSSTPLKVDVEGHDPDGNPVYYHYQWVRNGRDIPGANGKTLSSDHFKKGDSISILVTPSDGTLQGREASSGPVRILSSPPVVTSVTIEPELPRRNAVLKAKVAASDSDGDTIAFSYQWVKNGAVLMGESSDTLQDPTLKKGDRIILRVEPYDMEATGEEVVSQEVVILNSAPVITSSPRAQKLQSGYYQYQVVADDPDGDPITFSLSPSSPRGMTIDQRTGLVQWKIEGHAAGTHTIEITATDGDEGRCTQKYQLTLRRPRS